MSGPGSSRGTGERIAQALVARIDQCARWARIDGAGATPRAAVALVAAALALGGHLGLLGGDGAAGRLAGRDVAGRAHLLEAPRPGAFGSSAEVRMTSGAARGLRLLARLPRDARLPAGAGPGVELALAGGVRPLGGPGEGESGRDGDDGGADGDASAGGGYLDHLRATGVDGLLDVDRVRATGARRGGVSGLLDAIRRRADAAILAGLAPGQAAVARGMVLGADERIPSAVRDDFRDSGLAHLLAVSGQNVMLLVALAIPGLAAAGLSRRARVPPLIALIALYVPLAGGGASIQRAGVMGAAGLCAVMLGRPASAWYALGLAACATLALEPRATGDVGWQLSFVAVAGILVLAPRLRARLSALPPAAAEGIAITVAATVATAPLLGHHFGSVPLAGLPANVAALPLVAPIMWLGMARAALGQLTAAPWPLDALAGAANGALGTALAPLVAGLERIAALFADVPGGQLALPLASPTAVVLAYVAIAAGVVAAVRVARRLDTRATVAAARLRRLPRARRAALVVAVAAVAVLALARGLAPPGTPARLTVTFLDVGQGDATLVQHPDGTALLFDGGPPEAGVVRLLRRAGVRRLSVLAMTHPSRDHHGGLAEVVERIPVDVLLDGGDGTRDRAFRAVARRAVELGARRVAAVAPLTVDAGSMRVEVVGPAARPPGPPPADPNPRAVVAVVESGGFELLVSGDAESEALLPLALPDVDALKIPHHGSADPGLPELLDRLRPKLAAIPVGANGYGHPAPSTLSALRRADVPTWRTDLHGSIRLVVDRGALSVSAERGGPVEPAP